MWLTSILAIAAGVHIAIVNVRRSMRRFRTLVCEAVRCLLIVAAVILFWRPERTTQVEQTEPQQLVVLLDRSKSMATEDVDSAPIRQTRLSVAETVPDDEAWKSLDPRWQVVTQEIFADDPAQSDLGAAITQWGFDESAAACVLVSDGDWNTGRSPLSVVQEKTLQAGPQFTLHTIPIGQDSRLSDLELFGVSCPTIAIEGKPLRLPFAVANWFPDSQAVTVTFRVDGETVQQSDVTIAAGARFDGTVQWLATGEGNHDVSVSISSIAGESDATNNESIHQVDVRPESLRVLIIESKPRWEFRYLRNALIRDPGIEISSLLFHPSLETVGGGGTDYLDEFPSTQAELAKYDVIFLGDVGLDAKQLTDQQCKLLAGVVAEQATGLVLMPGPEMRQATLESTELQSLIPVIYDDAGTHESGADAIGHFALTEPGRSSLLTQLADIPSDNWKLWQSLPGFFWFAATSRAKSGSEVLAVHAESANDYGRLPLLVTRRFGAGKILWMGTDAAWRWRMGVEDKYHYRFWGQVIRWMAYGRNMAVGQSMRLIYQPEQPTVSSSVSLRASVMTSAGEPSSEANVDLMIETTSGESKSIRLSRSEGDWGVFVGETIFDEIGSHKVTLRHPSEDETLETEIQVQGRAVEAIGRPARLDVMADLARLGRGQVFAATNLGSLVNTLNEQIQQNQKTQTTRLWQHPIVLLGMIAGLSLFWTLRKWAGAL
ncbi:hypothetical protein CGZ80_10820 [Rhodopirellula sp. MGV]|nr:hypothetical protein CGZ80_10820 [Rhodopirellula sp. MGV]PNY33655.1 hypothetical protein C2E31_26470 [Rhodopirellula baltica]